MSNVKLHKLSIVILVVVSVSLNSCSRRSTIKLVSNSAPPTFDITGRAELDWIWVQGPFQNPHEPAPKIKTGSDPKEIILWQIRAPGFIPMNEVPQIVYGLLPKDWEQQIPRDGPPPALLNGYVYYIGVIAVRGGGAEMCIFLKDDQVQPFEEGSLCGRKK